MAGAAFAGAAIAAKDAAGDQILSEQERLRHERKSFANSTDAFSLAKPPPILDSDGNERVCKKSTRAKTQLKRIATKKNIEQGACGKVFTEMKTKAMDYWRRITESQCDPYVKVELRPAVTNVPIVQETDVIVGGGKFVEWTSFDSNNLIFLLETEPSKKYLNIEVFDQDIGADDRPLGRVPIRLESVTLINKQYYSRLNLYQGKKWTGQIDIGAKLEPYGSQQDDNDNDNNDENDEKKQLEIVNNNSNVISKSGTGTVNEKQYKYKLHITIFAAYELEDEDRTMTDEENFWHFVLGLAAFIGYLCFGAMIFSFVEEQEFGFMIWFFVVSTCTVGYGDFSPSTTLGHVLNSFFILSNLFIFAWAFSATFNYIYAQQEALLRKGGRTKTLRDFVQKFTKLSNKLDSYLTEVLIHEIEEDKKEKEQKQKEKQEKLKHDNDNNNNTNNNNNEVATLKRTRSRSRTSEELELKREKQKADQEKEEEFLDEELRFGVLINFALLGGLMLAGTLFYAALDYHEAEAQIDFFEEREVINWPSYYILDPVRFTIMTMTTVGYGDMYPQTSSGRLFGSFFLLIGVSFLTRIVGSVFEIVATKREQEQKKRSMERALLSANAMQEFDEDGSGDIDKYEFLKTMLIIRGEVAEGTIKRIMKKFDELDEDGSGEIDFADFVKDARRDTIREKETILSKDSRQRTVSRTQQELLRQYSKNDVTTSAASAVIPEPILPLATPVGAASGSGSSRPGSGKGKSGNIELQITPQTQTTATSITQTTPMTASIDKAILIANAASDEDNDIDDNNDDDNDVTPMPNESNNNNSNNINKNKLSINSDTGNNNELPPRSQTDREMLGITEENNNDSKKEEENGGNDNDDNDENNKNEYMD